MIFLATYSQPHHHHHHHHHKVYFMVLRYIVLVIPFPDVGQDKNLSTEATRLPTPPHDSADLFFRPL